MKLAFKNCLGYATSMSSGRDQEVNELRHRIQHETETIEFTDLALFYAKGRVIGVTSGLNLMDVAFQMSIDNSAYIDDLIRRKLIFRMDETTAKQWFEIKTIVLASVVSPWVLVQQVGVAGG